MLRRTKKMILFRSDDVFKLVEVRLISAGKFQEMCMEGV